MGLFKNSSKAFALFAAMAAMMPVPSAMAGSNTANVRSNKQAVVNDVTTPRPVSERNKFGGFSGRNAGHNWGVKNQRQYRKMLSSNPSVRRSKKNRCK